MVAFFNGLALGFSLILVIGAQNAYVLRQGLRNEHVFAICLACALSDAALISFGVAGFYTVIGQWPLLISATKVFGAAFLFAYGARCFYAAWRAQGTLEAAQSTPKSLLAALTTAMALTWLNPQVYLDTVVLLGSLSTNFPAREAFFAAGAVSASFLFFFSLGYGARLLRPLFLKSSSWRVLDLITGMTMWAIGLSLVL